MTALRTLFTALVLFLFLTLTSEAHAQAGGAQEDEDFRAMAMAQASLTSGMLAFDLGIAIDGHPDFGPRELRLASLSLGAIGFAGAHVAAFALLSLSGRESPRTRSILGGIALLSTGLSVLSLTLTSGWAIYTQPFGGTQDDVIGVLAPPLLGLIGLAGVIAGSVIIATASDDVDVSVSASPSSAVLTVSGRF